MYMKFLKYLLLGVAILLAGLIISTAIGYRYARQQPDFYLTYRWDSAQRSIVSQQALNKLLQTKELAAAAHFAEVRARTQTRPSASIQAITPRIQPLTVSFTQEELNAFIFHNLDTFPDLRPKIEQYVRQPGLFLQGGHLIIAGHLSGTDFLASAHLAPSIDEQGQLRLRFVRVMAGRLPVPRAMISEHLDRLQNVLAERLPDLQKEAEMDEAGGSNSQLVMAAASKLLLATLSDQTSSPVLFLPVDEKGKSVPLRLTKVEASDQRLSLTLEPMTPQQRQDILDQIRR
jgi:uncharacterized protein YpmS